MYQYTCNITVIVQSIPGLHCALGAVHSVSFDLRTATARLQLFGSYDCARAEELKLELVGLLIYRKLNNRESRNMKFRRMHHFPSLKEEHGAA